jgi:hypothetical protein
LIDYENGARALKPVLMVALEKALSDQGIIWSEDDDWVGVKIRRAKLDSVTPTKGE